MGMNAAFGGIDYWLLPNGNYSYVGINWVVPETFFF